MSGWDFADPMPEGEPTEADLAAMHPAARVMMGKSMAEMKRLVESGQGSPYGLMQDDHHIPPRDIKGRTGNSQRGVFTGKLDMTTGKLRVDHTVDMAFWLEIDLKDITDAALGWKYHPDNRGLLLAQQALAGLQEQEQAPEQEQEQA